MERDTCACPGNSTRILRSRDCEYSCRLQGAGVQNGRGGKRERENEGSKQERALVLHNHIQTHVSDLESRKLSQHHVAFCTLSLVRAHWVDFAGLGCRERHGRADCAYTHYHELVGHQTGVLQRPSLHLHTGSINEKRKNCHDKVVCDDDDEFLCVCVQESTVDPVVCVQYNNSIVIGTHRQACALYHSGAPRLHRRGSGAHRVRWGALW